MSTQETPEPPRQRRRQLSVLLVTAGVLVAGGGGAYLATSGGGNGSDTEPSAAGRSAPPPLKLDGFSLEGDTAPSGIAPGEPGGGTYRATGELPDGPGSAPVRPLAGDVTEAEVTALAKALDAAGTPRHDDGRWKVTGTKDGTGPTLTVGDEKGAGTWSFTRYAAPGGEPCVPPMPLPEPKAGGAEPSGTPGEDCPSHGAEQQGPEDSGSAGDDPVSGKEAKKAVRSVLPALDVAAGAELDASATHGALRTVSVRPQVAGMPTHGWTSTFTVGSGGEVVRGHGHLGELAEGDRYPVMSAERTLKQLNELGTPVPEGAEQKPAEVTGAEFGLTLRHSGGEPVLVPSWIYQVEQHADAPATEVTHPAVDPKLIEGRGDGGSGTEPGDTPTGAPEGEPVPGQQPVSYRADGSTLKVTFWGGVCHTYKATAEETAKKVTVGIEAKNPDPDKVCIKIAKKQTVEVELDKPLGDREVVDAQEGEPLPRKK